MKNFIRILSFFILCLSTQAQAALITFQVDMTGETVSPNGLHVIANFNGFSPNANLLTETSPGSNLYTVTVSLTTGDNIEYKFINGNDYGTGTVETPPTGCAYAINNNRSFTVPASDETLDVHTLDGCPVGYVMIPVTFCVDMANEDASLGVYLIGDFYGGFGSFLPLSLPAGQTTVYCTTYDIPEGVTRVNYKYTIGNNYDMQENSNTGACANGTDRFFDLTGANPDNSDIYFFNTCTASVLPIELKDFSVRAQKSNVLLTWETSIEMQTDYFLIEQSTDGRNFYPVHKETAAGDSEIEQYYEFTDENAHNGLNYYRLTTYDLDGTTHIEGVRTIEIKNQESGLVTIYPNPAQSYLQVNLLASDQEQVLTITDTYGRVLETRTIAENSSSFLLENLDNLNAGVYYLQLQSGNEVTSKTFIKQ